MVRSCAIADTDIFTHTAIRDNIDLLRKAVDSVIMVSDSNSEAKGARLMSYSSIRS
jgi:hypothetical protein